MSIKKKENKPSMRLRLVAALGSIATILMLSCAISILEYRRMSSYVSEKIASNINSLNQSQKLADMASELNLEMLSVVVRDDISFLPEFDGKRFAAQCDTLKRALVSSKAVPATDSVMVSFEAYIRSSLDFEEVFATDSVNTRLWFFDELQPKYRKLTADINNLNAIIHDDLRSNSENFDEGYYRGIMPGVVSVAVGLLLVFLLMYFVMSLYVNPLYKISEGLDNYLSTGRRYNNTFDGDDQIADINNGITEITEENLELKRRISSLRHTIRSISGNSPDSGFHDPFSAHNINGDFSGKSSDGVSSGDESKESAKE